MSRRLKKTNVLYAFTAICSVFLGIGVATAQSDRTFLMNRGVVDTVHSEFLNEDRLIYVDFPLEYDPTSAKKYPVAFLLDGDVLLPAAGVAQDYYSGGFTPEMIIIGISNAENRTRDLTPPILELHKGTTDTSDKMAMVMQPYATVEGGASLFLEFIEKELVPYVETKYPVTNFKTLIGHSYGGLFTLFALSEKPSLFNYYLAIDPKMDWSEGYYYKTLPEKLGNISLSGRSVFVTMSGQLHFQDTSVTISSVHLDDSWQTEFPRAILQTIDELEALENTGLQVGFKFFERDLHGTVPLPSLIEGNISLFKWYQMEGTHKINNPATSVEALEELMNYRAAKLKRNFGYAVPPYPEEILNMSGYMQKDMGDLEKSEMYFRAALKYYPNSANAHDSMADYYEATGELKKALSSVQRAQDLAPSEYFETRIKKLKQQIR